MTKWILLLCLVLSDAFAMQIKEMNSESRLLVQISKNELNRIAVRDDRIKDVFVMAGKFNVAKDELQGQLFVKLLGAYDDKPISMTIITEQGITQDLALLPTNNMAETIILYKGDTQPDEQIKPKDQIMDMVHAMAFGDYIKGCALDLQESDVLIWQDVEVKQKRVYRGSQLQGLVYQVRNQTGQPIDLSEQQFVFDEHTIAVAIRQKCLLPEEITEVYVVQNV